LAYNNGAKYILIFDSNEAYTRSILKEEHFEALEQFWQYKIDNPRDNPKYEEQVAFVLPEGYGYGFRGPEDKIWGLWESDSLSFEISYKVGNLLEEYGTRLDIVYNDHRIDLREKYSQIIMWNNKDYIPYNLEPPTDDAFSVFVSEVIDGDTFTTSEGYRVRLADINAPELGEVGYNESREFLQFLIEEKKIILDIDNKTGADSYGRYISLAYVLYNSTHYINVNQILVDKGYAIINDYSNNEFDPNIWPLYIERSSIPEFKIHTIFLLFIFVTFFVAIIKFKTKKIENK
jgi:hypothetical protein